MGRIKPGTYVEPHRARRNERERNRVNQINDQFELLREVIDRVESYPRRRRKLTRTEIVYEAITIIRNLERMLGIEGSSEYSLPDLHDHQYLVEPKTETSSDPQCSSGKDYVCSSESLRSSPPDVNEIMSSSLQSQQNLRKIGKKRKFKAPQQGVPVKATYMPTPVITNWPFFDYTAGYYRSSPSPSGFLPESLIVRSQSEVPAKMARMVSPPVPEFPMGYEVAPSPSSTFESPEMVPQPEMTDVWRVASPVSEFTKYPEASSSPPTDATTFVEMKPAPQADDMSLEMARIVTPPASHFKTTYYAASASPSGKNSNSEMRTSHRSAMFKIEPIDDQTNVDLLDDYSFSGQHMEMMSYFL